MSEATSREETRTKQTEEEMNSWLPITANREAKWWYSAFQNVTAMVGIIGITLSWLITLYTLWQLVELHEDVPGKRFDRYPELGEHAYSAIACVTSIIFGVKNNHLSQPSYGVRGKTTAGIIFDVFNAIGTLAFSFAGHSIVLEVQATIPSTPEKPSNKPMWKGVVVAYIIVALCYFPVAIAGFWAYGNAVEDDILISLEHPPWLISLANFMVFLHVIGSWQVYAMPVFDMLESYLVKNLNFKPSTPLRLIGRSGYVALTSFVGICIPFFGGLLGFCGGLIFAPISYFVPCIMWQILRKPKRWSFHWYACWICNVLGVLVMLLSPIGGTREIVLSFKSYKFFS
ncbi:hypothetical protein MKW94_015021 [Papaver nudicaule]|uniref:Amino acid transporter transmembrane domain-containing protein n=1 Tax=Papaver nudicaule TaxID=74823 RepID=A0AA41VXX6_PAPNU|nr:hypothetical protein [Papaver nudicaule]